MSDLRRFESGQRARARESEDDSQVVVLGANGKTAEAAPEGACVRSEICGNVVPARGLICGDCLDEIRAADRDHEAVA